MFEMFVLLINRMNLIFHFSRVPNMAPVFEDNKAVKLACSEISNFKILFPAFWRSISFLQISSVTWFFLTFPISYSTKGFAFEKALIFLFVENFSNFMEPSTCICNNTLSLDIFFWVTWIQFTLLRPISLT